MRIDNSRKLINRLTDLASEKSVVFRGYCEETQMLPKIIRNNLVDAEFELLKGFEKYGMNYVNVNGAFDLVTWAQHYGLSTRLLDFTYNPFIALYFSLYSKEAERYFIRFCNTAENILFKDFPTRHEFTYGHYESTSYTSEFKKMIEYLECALKWGGEESEGSKIEFLRYLQTEIESSFQALSAEQLNLEIKHAAKKFTDKKLLFVDTNQSNQRIIMQQGLFLFPYDMDANGLKNMIECNTNKIEIDKNLREPLLTYLDKIGINAFRIMPDLASVCAAVEQSVKEELRKE